MNESIPQLTSMRFFWSIAIVYYHMRDYSSSIPQTGPILKLHLAVDFFFILSGFILTLVYGERFKSDTASTYDYLVARIARIYPVHLTVMLAFVVLVLAMSSLGMEFNAQRYRPIAFFWHIALLDAWGFDDSLTWNYPAWSISAEFAAYCLFPFIIGPIMRLRIPAAIISLLALCITFMLCNHLLDITSRTINFSIIRVIPEFIMGMLAARLSGTPSPTLHANFAFCLIALLVSGLLLYEAPDEYTVVVSVALIGLAPHISGPLRSLLSWRPLVYLGAASYSLYMVHAFVLSIFYNAMKLPLLGSKLPVPFRDGICLALTVIVASMLFHFVENPCRHIIRAAFTHFRGIPVAAEAK
jgi:peptidoglycan/LPS O-acetylase OafA/YrhL